MRGLEQMERSNLQLELLQNKLSISIRCAECSLEMVQGRETERPPEATAAEIVVF